MAIDQAALIQTVYDTIFSTFIQAPQTGQPTQKNRDVLLTFRVAGATARRESVSVFLVASKSDRLSICNRNVFSFD